MANENIIEGNQISFGTQGKDVALLHQVLTAIGIEINEEELKKQLFGETTEIAVLNLQRLAGFKPTGAIDRQMSGILSDALQRLQVDSPRKNAVPQVRHDEYCVEGDVTDIDGMPLAGAKVVAVICNLRETHEIGQSQTDNEGHYRICCSAAAFGQKKSSTAGDQTGSHDLQLKVFSQEGETLYTSEIYFHVTSGANIPIALGGSACREPSEFARLGIALAPHLGDLRLEDLVEGPQFQDLTLLAGKTGSSKKQTAFYSVAARLAESTGLSPKFFYGLFSQNIPTNASVLVLASTSKGVDFSFNAQRMLNFLLSTSDAILAEAIETAISKNIIPASYKSMVQDDLAKLVSLRTNAALSATWGMGKTPIKAVLDLAAIPEDKQKKFVALYSARGSSEDFWEDLREHSDFTEEEVERLRFSIEMGRLTYGHPQLIENLLDMRKQGKIKGASDLARLDANDWKTHLNNTHNGKMIGVPANLMSKNPQDGEDYFANMLKRNFERAHPTTAFFGRLAKDENSPFEEKDALVEFFEANPDFDLFNTNVDLYLKEKPAVAMTAKAVGDAKPAAGSNHDKLRNTLNKCKRLAKLGSNYEAARTLLADGIDSSQPICAMGRSQFVRKYGDQSKMGLSQAEDVYYKAEQTHALALTIAMNSHPIVLNGNPAAIGNVGSEQKQEIIKQFPNLETLFGSFDLCDCDPSKTVLSPAAYLVDMLHFLSQRYAKVDAKGDADTQGPKVKEILLKRRPDLTQIKLNSANTNIVLPYIDLVNELLEDAVAFPDDNNATFEARKAAALKRQTTLTAEEMNANPEHINNDAYAKLATAVFPWILPFDLPLIEARTYLRQLGVDRLQLMRTFQKTPEIGSQQMVDMAVEGLGLSKTEAEIIAGTSSHKPWEYWGFPSYPTKSVWAPEDILKLSEVRYLLNHSGLTYHTLTQLLNTSFINSKATIQLRNEPPDSCDLDTMTIGYVFNWEKIPGEDNGKLIKFLSQRFGVDWVKTAKIEKIDNGKTIKVSSGKNYLSLKLNDKSTEVIWEIDDGRTNNFRFYAKQTITGKTDIYDIDLDRLPCFVRLMRRLNWDVYTLDSAITLLLTGAGSDAVKLNMTTLRQLYAIKTAMKRFQIPANVATALFAPIETRDVYDYPYQEEKRQSLYHSLFQNSAVLNSDEKTVDKIFDLNDKGTEIKLATIPVKIEPAVAGKPPMASAMADYTISTQDSVQVLETNQVVTKGLTPDKASPAVAGTTITWTAVATKGPIVSKLSKENSDTSDKPMQASVVATDIVTDPMMFKFLLNGTPVGGWGAKNTWVWKTSAKNIGKNKVQVMVRVSNGKHDGPDGSDGSVTVDYTIYDPISPGPIPTPKPVEVKSLEPDKMSPMLARTAITWTAIAVTQEQVMLGLLRKDLDTDDKFRQASATSTDSEDSTLLFKFFLNGTPMGEWEAKNTWVWKTSINDIGDYQVSVWIRDGKHAGPKSKDDSAIVGCTISPVVVNSLAPDKPGPIIAGTTIAWTAIATDAENNPLQFKFFLNGTPMTDWGTGNTWVWKTSNKDAGNNHVSVWVRDGKHAGIESKDGNATMDYTVIPNLVLKPNKPSPITAGTAITWTAEATGSESNALRFRFLLNGTPMTDWGTDNTWVWKTSIKDIGNNQVQVMVWVRDGIHAGPGGSDSSATMNYTVNAPSGPLLADHKPTLLGAFEVSDTDLTLAIDSFTDGLLNLANLSALYRHVMLAKGLGISTSELISLKALFEIKTEQSIVPYEHPELLATFCEAIDVIHSTNFSATDLDYILRHRFNSTSGLEPGDAAVGTLLKSILDGLNKIAKENMLAPDPTGTETRRRLLSLLSPVDVESIMAILAQKEAIRDDEIPLIISDLGSYMDMSTAKADLSSLQAGQARYEFVLKGLLAYFRRSQGIDLIVQHLAGALGLPTATTAVLVTKWFPSSLDPKDTAKAMIEDFLMLFDVVREPSYNGSITLNPNVLDRREIGKNIASKSNETVPFEPFFINCMALDKAAKVINGFGLTSDEVDWLRSNGVKQGWLDLTQLPLTGQDIWKGKFFEWRRLADAVAVKKTLPSDGTSFTSLMDLARNEAKKETYLMALSKRTQWSEAYLKILCGDPTNKIPDPGLLSLKYPEDYCSERALTKLIPAFALLQRLGISADVSSWIGPTIKPEQASFIKQSLKAKYSSDQWLQIAKQLRDPLREQQRDALVAYLLVHPPAWASWNDVNDIYSYLLIDVEMSACQGTSRIVQANSSIQLFVMRCLLNLETDVTVDVNVDDKWLQWQLWMSRYRLWEANRKVFLYPENWIEPSLRRDKSPFMVDLENELLQNEITKDTAEDAFLSYLEKLDAVSRLQVIGMYYDS